MTQSMKNEYKEIRKDIIIPLSLYQTTGKIDITQLYEKKSDESIEFDVKIKEYPELVVESNGSIQFPQDKKYKSSEDVHIDGTITILEPNFVYKYVKTIYETIYIKEHYRDRIVGTIMCEDIFEQYLDHETYHTKEEYEENEENMWDDMRKEEKQTKIVLNDSDEIDYEDPNVSYELVREGFKTKKKFELIDHLTKYDRLPQIHKKINIMRSNCFVKSITIRTDCDGKCHLILNGYTAAEIPFNTKFDLTEKNGSILYRFHKMSHRYKDIDAFHSMRFENIELYFYKPIEDFDLIIEDVNFVDNNGNYQFLM